MALPAAWESIARPSQIAGPRRDRRRYAYPKQASVGTNIARFAITMNTGLSNDAPSSTGVHTRSTRFTTSKAVIVFPTGIRAGRGPGLELDPRRLICDTFLECRQ